MTRFYDIICKDPKEGLSFSIVVDLKRFTW
jgi:hypothetical protein